jgi:hypothetical protein
MSSTTWGIIGAGVCVGGFQLLRYGVGRTAGYVFAGVVVGSYLAVHCVYRRRLTPLRDEFAQMSEEEQSRFFQEVDPEIAEDLKKKKGDTSNG